jgi:hypothetical protein
MMATARTRELNWIRKRLLSLAPKVARFGLQHLISGEAPATLATFCRDDSEVEAQAKAIAAECDEQAKAHAEAFAGSTQQYGIVAWDEADRVIGQIAFRLHEPSDSIDSQPTDPPTERGALSQAMRQTEAFARMIVLSLRSVLEALAAENERQSKRLEASDAMQLKVFELLAELGDATARRKLEERSAERSEARKDRWVTRIEEVVGPPLLERIVGGGPVDKLIDSLSMEQITKLLEASLLTPAQMENVAEIVRRKAEIRKPPDTAGKGGNGGKEG